MKRGETNKLIKHVLSIAFCIKVIPLEFVKMTDSKVLLREAHACERSTALAPDKRDRTTAPRVTVLRSSVRSCEEDIGEGERSGVVGEKEGREGEGEEKGTRVCNLTSFQKNSKPSAAIKR